MTKPKLVLIDGMPTSGKSTVSYELAKNLPGWVLVDIWRIKDMFEPIGYSDRSSNITKEERDSLRELSKENTLNIAKDLIRKTQRNMILQDMPEESIKKKLGSYLKKYNYKIYNIQLTVPFREAVKRNKKREKPSLKFMEAWTKDRWEEKVKRKPKEGDVAIDTSKNSKKQVVDKILKTIGEKPRKHHYKNKIRKFW